MAPPDLKKMLQVKIKPRQDSYTDQFSRILMVKMLLMTAAITGISWMKDKFTCIVPKKHDVTAGFVAKACWINGVYIYRGLKDKEESFYYGIPADIALDGRDKHGDLCTTNILLRTSAICNKLEKTFFLQYQWFPLGVAALAFLYYLPYLLFRVVNNDMQGLKDAIKGKKTDEIKYNEILKTYFKTKKQEATLRTRVMLNVIVKLLYVVANVVGMIVIDSAVNGQFISYGGRWNKWLGLSNDGRHDYTQDQNPKAGNYLLPAFGLCQVQSAGQDIKNKVINIHTYVCEMSQHILYQYILIIMWYMFVVGIVVSIIGLIKHLFDQISAALCSTAHGDDVKRVYRCLSVREKQYMHFIQRKSLPVFGELLRRLRLENECEGSTSGSSCNSYNPSYPEKERFMMS